ncbi:MAG: nitroreductase [Candidatus Methanomethylophilaceae archaeon]|nr:nitroreductase [Candidatus Methanomethylophilaceae archaeon]
MDLDTAIYGRHSVRSYTDEPVTDSEIQAIIDAGCQAPSPKNRQPWRIAIVKQPRLTSIADRLATEIAAPNNLKRSAKDTMMIMKEAPVGLFFFLEKSDDYTTSDIASVGCPMQNMMLKAYSLGLGTLWCGDILFCQHKFADLFGNKDLIACLLIGHENIDYPRKIHKSPEDLVLHGYDERSQHTHA